MFLRKLWFLFRRRRLDRDLAEEMEQHLEMRAQKLIAAGEPPEEARYRARREFGNSVALRETSRDVWGWCSVERLLQDLRYAIRLMRRSPGFTAVAVISLTLGIGGNTAIFSLVNAVLLRPLPYREPERLVAVWEWNIRERHINTVADANFADWKARNRVFEDLGYSWDEGYTFTGSDNPEAVAGYTFSCNIFPMLGAKPLLGRTFLPAECQPGRDHVVLLSFAVWQRRFGADRAIVGRSIQLNRTPYVVIGVMPPEFAHPSSRTALWTPLALSPDAFADRKDHAFRVLARLKPGISLARAQSEMDAIARQLAVEHPDTNTGMGVQLWPIRDFYLGNVKTALVVLQAAVFLMLLIACVNIANLLVARTSAREREVAVRLALGAGRGRLFRQFLTEGVLLALVGGVAGIAAAYWGVSALASLLPPGFAEVDTSRPQAWLNVPVMLFGLLLATISGVVFGLAPVYRSSASPGEGLRAGGRAFSDSRAKMRLRSALVVAQIALSLMLLIGAGLLTRSFLRLQARDFGFRTGHVLTLQLLGRSSGFRDSMMAGFLAAVLERIEALPGVEAAGAINAPPLTGMSAHRNFTIPGRPEVPFGQQTTAGFHVVTPHYFQAMGIRLLRGRYFDQRDRAGAPGVAIINETTARRFFPRENPVGSRITVADGDSPETREIVGVVGDTRHEQLADEPAPEIYRPFGQADWPFAGIAVRTSGDPLALAAAVRRAIWSADKEQPIDQVTTLDQRAADSVAPRRANTILLGLFAAIALLLSAIGIYGVMAYSVSRRVHEIGIRVALGAHGRDVLAMMLRQAGLLTLTGTVIGWLGAASATRLMGSLLVDISATDPVTFAAISVLLSAVAVLAAWLPAWRASRIAPLEALRDE
ncbi:MAG TPA: ABC transporter permease [Bryobacteraceae bacterium]|nr:ABC transporter permease [Bryobacteraceae bacterium]